MRQAVCPPEVVVEALSFKSHKNIGKVERREAVCVFHGLSEGRLGIIKSQEVLAVARALANEPSALGVFDSNSPHAFQNACVALFVGFCRLSWRRRGLGGLQRR